jgi:hypothetical protein
MAEKSAEEMDALKAHLGARNHWCLTKKAFKRLEAAQEQTPNVSEKLFVEYTKRLAPQGLRGQTCPKEPVHYLM